MQMLIQSAAFSLLPLQRQPSQRCSKLISRIVIQEVSCEVKNDPLVNLVPDYWRNMGASNQRMVMSVKRGGSRGELTCCQVLWLQRDTTICFGVTHISISSGSSKESVWLYKYMHDTPSLAIKLGPSLKTIHETVIEQSVKAEDEAAASRVRSLLDLLAAAWDLYEPHHARTIIEEDRCNKKKRWSHSDKMSWSFIKYWSKKTLLERPNLSANKTISECLLFPCHSF